MYPQKYSFSLKKIYLSIYLQYRSV